MTARSDLESLGFSTRETIRSHSSAATQNLSGSFTCFRKTFAQEVKSAIS